MNFSAISMILVLIACSMAFPTIDGIKYEVKYGRSDRQRRVTCDLLGFMGDSACAANCLSMGKSGGKCSDGVCHCRQEDFSDVWDRRMAVTSKNPSETPQEFLDRYNSRRNDN